MGEKREVRESCLAARGTKKDKEFQLGEILRMRDFESKKFLGIWSDEDFGFDGLSGVGLGEDFFDDSSGGPGREVSGREDAEGDIGGGFGSSKRKREVGTLDDWRRLDAFNMRIKPQRVFEEIIDLIAIRISGIGGDEGIRGLGAEVERTPEVDRGSRGGGGDGERGGGGVKSPSLEIGRFGPETIGFRPTGSRDSETLGEGESGEIDENPGVIGEGDGGGIEGKTALGGERAGAGDGVCGGIGDAEGEARAIGEDQRS